MRHSILFLGLLIAACLPTEGGQGVVEAGAVVVSGDGVGVQGNGTSIKIKFGGSRSDVEQLFVRSDGPELALSVNEECGAGPMTIQALSNGLALNFKDDVFVGWFLDGETIVQTDKGVSPGDPVSDFLQQHRASKVHKSTLGAEFYSETEAIGAFGGEAGENGPIEALYAGTNCFFR